jgi:hypothetical protein
MADVASIPFINFGLSQAQQGQASASANLTNQQAQAAAMQNRLTQAAMPMALQAISEASADQSGANPGNPAAGQTAVRSINGQSSTDDDTGTGYGYDGANLETGLRNANYVPPYTQAEQQQLYKWSSLSGLPGMAGEMAKAKLQALQTQRQARIDTMTAQNQQNMGNMYDTWSAASKAPDPLSALAAVPGGSPVAAQINANHPDDPDGAREEAKAFLEHGASVSHLYSGRPTKDVNGQLIDEKTSQPVTGQKQVYLGSTPEQLGNDRKWAAEDVEVPTVSGTNIKMARWRAPEQYGGFGGKVTPDQYALQQDQARRKLSSAAQSMDSGGPPVPTPSVPNQPTPVPQQPGTATTPAAPASSKPAVGQVAQRKAATAKATAQQTTPAADQYGTAPPVGTPEYGQRMQVALDNAKPAQYGPQNTTNKIGLPQVGLAEGVKNYQEQQKELRSYGAELASSSDQALQNFNAAKRLLAGDTSLPATGPIGAALQKASAALGLDTNTAAVRQEAAKYLVQGSLAGLKQTYGSKPGVFDVKVNLEKAFPNLENMGINEVRNLIDSQITQAQYMKDSGNRATQYADRGYEPGDFSNWNARFFPRANIVTPPEGNKQPNVTQAQHAALKQGDPFYWNGALHHKGVD